jgi:hypothetical protein
VIPEWVVIAFALGSCVSVYKYFGGHARVLARFWVVGFYLFLWFGPNNYTTNTMAALSRYGLIFIFISDIVPALVAAYQRKKVDL